MPIENPTIVIPGILGSSLENFYPLQPDTTWSDVDAATMYVFGPRFDQLALDPTATCDKDPGVVTRAAGLLRIAYSPLVNALRRKRQLPVYVFPYDWRYSVAKAADKLVEFTDAVSKKTGAEGKIDFVCRSMGGLVFRSFLGKIADVARIGRVVFLAVPHRGSLDAAEAMIRGETTLFGGRKEMRKLARTFLGLYELLPRFEQALVDEAGKELSVFEIGNWQRNVTRRGGAEVNGFDVEKHHLVSSTGKCGDGRCGIWGGRNAGGATTQSFLTGRGQACATVSMIRASSSGRANCT